MTAVLRVSPFKINVHTNTVVIEQTVIQCVPDPACLKLACPVSKDIALPLQDYVTANANNQNYPGKDIR